MAYDDDNAISLHVQVRTTVRSHFARWKDGRHFQQTTRVSIFASAAGDTAADHNFDEEAGDDEKARPVCAAAGHRSSVESHQGDDREPSGTQLVLMHTTALN